MMSIIDQISAREQRARKMLFERSDVTLDELRITAAVLARLGEVKIDDLCVPPGFNLLPDGDVGSINADTPEYRLYAELRDLVDDARRLGHQLTRAEVEAGHRR